jgi:cyclopropane-fatty-acyl-phospholipid synthase
MNAHSMSLSQDDQLREALKGAPSSLKFAASMVAKLKRGTLRITLPGGRVLNFNGEEEGPQADITIHDYAFTRRVLTGGIVGVGESYIDGHWDTTDLTAMLELFAVNLDVMQPSLRGNALTRALNKVYHFMHRNTKSGSKRNIHEHYDIGNAFYSHWLDDTMTYSSALFDESRDLTQGQTRKYAALADQLSLNENSEVLEIGCGWGGFAEYAAKHRGAKITGLTISQEQHDFAMQRMQREGLSEKVDIRLQDYRDVQGRFDGIASIEMFEAVGEKYWPVYFERVRNLLQPGGSAALQIITIDEEIFPRYRRSVDFIQRYVFPGGMLPSITRLKEEFDNAGLKMVELNRFGEDYARTLKMWAETFNAKWDDIQPMGFDKRFRRLWNFYLSYCEAGFKTGRTDVGQFRLVAS